MWRRKPSLALMVCLVFVVALILAGGFSSPASAKEPIIIGLMTDLTGPTQLFGIPMTQAAKDYIELFNKKGGVDGHPIKVIYHEMAYKVPLAVEAYERFKAAGAVYYPAWGTPIIYALAERTTKDKIPTITPGFGRADAADGKRFPYIFPMAATYWSQAGAALKYVLDQWEASGNKGMPKIAFLYWDNPAGREPFPIFERLQKKLGFKFKSWGVPSPGIEMSAQILDIVKRYKADWVITHMWSKAPAISIKEFNRIGYPLDHVVSFVWGITEHDMTAASWEAAQGYSGLQFAGAGLDYPVLKEIRQMYKDKGKPPPREMMEITIPYNRGILWAAAPLEAIRLGYEAHGWPLTGEKVQKGFELIKNFGLGGLLPPLTVTPEDHEGGGYTMVVQVKGKKFVKKTEWFHGFRAEVMAQLEEAAKAGD